MNRQPPPPPHQHNTNLLHPRQLQSRGETDISYDAYSPSPSSLSAHRNKYNRIQDWAVYNAINRSRQLAGMARHDPSMSMGIGTASWSDTGTGITGDRSDVGTVPTTVRNAKEGGGREVPREKVDVRREMSENRAKQYQAQAKGVQRKPSRLGQELELDASELPYRQSSLRRDDPPPPANGSAPDKSQPIKLKPVVASKPAAQKPQLVHSRSTKPPPTPLLAKPPTPPKDIPLIPGTPMVTSPESDKRQDQGGGKVMSPWAIREAYLESALTLPIDMLSGVQKEKEKHLQTPATALKTAKSTSSISSGVTLTRLASLLGNGNKVSLNTGNKALGEGAATADTVRQMGSNKTVGSKPVCHLSRFLL
jgi:hypothetical protein